MIGEHRFLAFDLGAESGRAVVGVLGRGRLTIEEMHRFANRSRDVNDALRWDVGSLYKNVLKGIHAYVERFGASADGIAIDTWALDFGLLDENGSLLEDPVCYRDKRTEGMADIVTKVFSRKTLYELTGMNLLGIETLCQLLALRRSDSPLLNQSRALLMIPDLLGYFLTGEKRCERTDAVTSQLYNSRTRGWCDEIFAAFDLPRDIMPTLVDPGTRMGELTASVKTETGIRSAPVIAPCTHDTGSAVAAVPGQGDDWAFISSGTWSVVGALTDEIVTAREAFAAGLCNELTLGGPFLCRNIMGLWLLQRLRSTWKSRGEAYAGSYAQLVKLAESAPGGGPLINVDDPAFLAPENMESAIYDYCGRTGQREPSGPASVVRCVLESLALSYRQTLDHISGILGRTFRKVHVVGGGSLNTLLCQFTSNATGIPVLAGPVEATASGNILAQAFARGLLSSPEEVREVVRHSTDFVEYQPEDAHYWEDRYASYVKLESKLPE